jgi:hypothetical protein
MGRERVETKNQACFERGDEGPGDVSPLQTSQLVALDGCWMDSRMHFGRLGPRAP